MFQPVEGEFAEILLRPAAESALEQTGVRLYPLTGFAHAAMDAALTLAPIVADSVDEVRVRVSPPAAAALASNPEPRTDDERWWSIEHAVAVCLATGDADTADRAVESDDVKRLRNKVVLEPIEAGWAAAVEIRLSDGASLAAQSERPRGHGNDVTDGQLCVKWSSLTGEDGAPILARLRGWSSSELFATVVHHLLGQSDAERFHSSPSVTQKLNQQEF